MELWCIKENNNAINFYIRKVCVQIKEKTFTLAGKDYSEIAFLYNL